MASGDRASATVSISPDPRRRDVSFPAPPPRMSRCIFPSSGDARPSDAAAGAARRTDPGPSAPAAPARVALPWPDDFREKLGLGPLMISYQRYKVVKNALDSAIQEMQHTAKELREVSNVQFLWDMEYGPILPHVSYGSNRMDDIASMLENLSLQLQVVSDGPSPPTSVEEEMTAPFDPEPWSDDGFSWDSDELNDCRM